MIRVSVLWLAVVLLGSCTQKMICPAYQSSFIYDKESLRKKFSYFKEDSTPRVYTASKTKYLIAVPESYRKKTRSLHTVEMLPVYPVIPDSMKVNKGERELMTDVDVVDSSGAEPPEEVYAITKTKEKYNVDQDIYMWYFRDMLVLPDVRAAMETKDQGKGDATGAKKKKGLFSFLKKKSPADSLAVEETVPTDSIAAPRKKKGIFGNKKNKSEVVAPAKKKDPAKKEEDDGF